MVTKTNSEKKLRINVIHNLLRLGIQLEKICDRITINFGINQQQFVVLTAISKKETIYQKDIITNLLFEKSNISKIIKKLEKMNFIKITSSDEDKRLKKIDITPLGRDTSLKIQKELDLWNKNFFSKISTADIENASEITNLLWSIIKDNN